MLLRLCAAAAAAMLLARAAQRDAVAALVGSAGSGTRVTWDHRFGTPRTILNAKGYLSGPTAGSAVDVARAWLDDHRAALGLSASDVQALAVTHDHALPGTGIHVVDLQQVVAGVLTVAGGRLIVAVTANGRVLSYAGDAGRSPGGLGGAYALSPAQALAKVAGALAPGVAFTPSQSRTQAGYDVFARGPLATVQRVSKAAFLQAAAALPAYRVLFVPKLDEGYDVVVDAGTGAVLYRRSLVAHESEGSVHENFPGAPQGGTQVTKSFGSTAQPPGGYTDPTDARRGRRAAGLRHRRDDRHAHPGPAGAALHRLGDDRHRQPHGLRSHRAAERLRRDRHGVHEHVHRAARVARRRRLGLDAAQGLRRRHPLDHGHRRRPDPGRPRPRPVLPRQPVRAAGLRRDGRGRRVEHDPGRHGVRPHPALHRRQRPLHADGEGGDLA